MRALASAVRTDPDCLRALDPVDAEIVQLREWSCMIDELTAQRTKPTHRFREQLWRYYPQFLELGSSLSSAWLIELWNRMPTPAHARRIRRYSATKPLKPHRIRWLSAEQVLQILRSKPVHAALGVTEAAISHIRVLVQLLASIEKHTRDSKRSIDVPIERYLPSKTRSWRVRIHGLRPKQFRETEPLPGLMNPHRRSKIPVCKVANFDQNTQSGPHSLNMHISGCRKPSFVSVTPASNNRYGIEPYPLFSKQLRFSKNRLPGAYEETS